MNKSDFFTADAVKPHFTYDDYCESADMIASHLGDFRPEVLLVLGSGLGFLGDRVEARTCVSYADIPHFRASTAPGHEGRFVFGELRGKRVAVMQGRMHCYEGYTMEDAAYACRVIRLLGAKTMIVTNAAGAVNTEYSAGDLMLISDHIKLWPALGAEYRRVRHTLPRYVERLLSPPARACQGGRQGAGPHAARGRLHVLPRPAV